MTCNTSGPAWSLVELATEVDGVEQIVFRVSSNSNCSDVATQPIKPGLHQWKWMSIKRQSESWTTTYRSNGIIEDTLGNEVGTHTLSVPDFLIANISDVSVEEQSDQYLIEWNRSAIPNGYRIEIAVWEKPTNDIGTCGAFSGSYEVWNLSPGATNYNFAKSNFKTTAGENPYAQFCVRWASSQMEGPWDNSASSSVVLRTAALTYQPAQIVDISSTGEIGDAEAYAPNISGDGNYIVYESSAQNLSPDIKRWQTNVRDIFLFDVQNGTTHLVSKSRAGNIEGNAWSPDISQDGNYVTFHSRGVFSVDNGEHSYSCNMSDTAPLCNDLIFIYQRTSEELSRLFPYYYHGKNDSQAKMSSSGRYVFFLSNKTDLDSSVSDGNNDTDVYVKDRNNGTISLAYPYIDPIQLNNLQVSGDGRYLAVTIGGSAGCASNCPSRTFGSWDNDFGTGNSNNRAQIYLVDQQTNDIELVSSASGGSLGNDHSVLCYSDRNGSFHGCSSLSTDGRYIAFTSRATNIVTGPNGDYWQTYVKDLQQGTTEIVSISSTGNIGNGDSQAASISGDGRFIVFESKATNLDTIDDNAAPDIYVHDRLTNTTVLVTRSFAGGMANGFSGAPDISADGQYIVFQSGSSNLLETPTGVSDNHIYRIANPLR